MAVIISVISWLPPSAASMACLESMAACLVFSLFWRTMEADCWSVAEVSSMEAASSELPSASC